MRDFSEQAAGFEIDENVELRFSKSGEVQLPEGGSWSRQITK
jgi:hypothetical protein